MSLELKSLKVSLNDMSKDDMSKDAVEDTDFASLLDPEFAGVQESELVD